MSDEDHEDEETYSSIKTVLGGTRRDQRWHLTDEVDVVTFLGSSRFDLRDVETSGGEVVEINVTCVLGVVDLVVPAGTMVVLDGTSFLASAKSRVAAGSGSHLPRLEVTATTVLGRVRVRTRVDDEVETPEPAVVDFDPVAIEAPAPEVAAPAAPARVAPVAPDATAPQPVDDDTVAEPATT